MMDDRWAMMMVMVMIVTTRNQFEQNKWSKAMQTGMVIMTQRR